MKHSSDLLLHFVDRAHRDDPRTQIETCLEILDHGFRFSPQLSDLGSSVAAEWLTFGIHAVCFTDIPLRLSEGHAARYGKCAIGVRKSRVKTWGGNPVLYVGDCRASQPQRSDTLHVRTDLRGVFGEYVVTAIRTLAEASRKKAAIVGAPEPPSSLPPEHWVTSLTPAQRDGLLDEFGYLLGYVKEMFDLGLEADDEDEPRRDRYYMEREWRIGLTGYHKAIADRGDQGSGLVRAFNGRYFLPLRRKDVRVIIVPNEHSREQLITSLTERVVDPWKPHEIPPVIIYEESKDL